MKDIPQKIYLQLGLEDNVEYIPTFNDLDTASITWGSEKIFTDDLEFIYVDFILARIKELEDRKFNLTTMDGVNNFNMNSAVINQLKNLIK